MKKIPSPPARPPRNIQVHHVRASFTVLPFTVLAPAGGWCIDVLCLRRDLEPERKIIIVGAQKLQFIVVLCLWLDSITKECVVHGVALLVP